MTSRLSRFALPMIIAALIVLPACTKRPIARAGPLTITLAYDKGQCTQNGSTGVIEVEADQDVTFQLVAPGANSQFDVEFSSCPFASGKCPANSPTGNSKSMGKPTAASVNNTYYYGTVTIDNQTCNNGIRAFGMHIKPGT